MEINLKLTIPFFLPAAFMLLLAACGGGSQTADTPIPTPTPVAEPREEQSSNSQMEPNCVDDVSPIFTNHITDLERVASIVNLGMVSDNTIAQHTYVHPIQGIGSDSEDRKIPIYAPMRGQLYDAGYSVGYDPATKSAKAGEEGQYLLYFQVSCQVTIRLAHVAGVVDKLAERLPSSPKFDSRTDGIEPPVMFEAGEQIGWFLLDGQALDFGLYNTEHINMFINQERYRFFQQPLHADCPYDYFQESLRSQYYALFGTPWLDLFPDSHCGTVSRDVAGTIAGQWFNAPWPPPGLSPGEAQGGGEMAVAIGNHRDGTAEIGGPFFHLRIHPSNPTHADPTLVTTENCYSDRSQFVFLKVLSDDRLGVANGSGECPSNMHDEYITYYR